MKLFRSKRCLSTLTSEKYTSLKRGNYAALEDKDLKYFKSILSANQIVTDSDELEGYNTDWLRSCKGASKLLLRPRNTAEVVDILKHCSQRRLAICPQGGNTGLVGGSVPVFDEIILSTTLMNKVINFDEHSGVLTCQAGCVLDMLNNCALDKGYTMPLDLGAKGSCQIGGNIATNAGGIHFIRYGSLHGSILGLEVVLANGDVLDMLTTMKKDNTGYDLKHLFIGSEGTLGIVTKAAILCPIKPRSQIVAFIACSNFENVLHTSRQAKEELNETLSSLEYLDHGCVELVQQHLNLISPIKSAFPFYMLVEVAGSNCKHDEEKLEIFLEKVFSQGYISDGIIVKEPSHIQKVWQLRERITEALRLDGYVYKYDVSVPMQEFSHLVTLLGDRLCGLIRSCVGYGHLGDGNLHLNMTSVGYNGEVESLIEPFIFEQVQKLGGSISAEHGIGFKKRQYVHFSKSQMSIATMKNIKSVLDPGGILNPYKIFI